MRIVCVQDFGSHKRGDFLEVPDGSEVAPQYFMLADEEPEKAPPTASPEAKGEAVPADNEPEKE